MSGQEELSALLDAELSVEAQAQLFEAMAGREDLREQWQCYQLIGEGLREAQAELPLTLGLAARVMAQLASEPTWSAEAVAPAAAQAKLQELSPPVVSRPAANQARWSQLSGLAAALSGVAVVAWLALSAQGSGQPSAVADKATLLNAATQGAAQASAAGAASAPPAQLAVADTLQTRRAPPVAAPGVADVAAAPLADAQAEHLRTYLVAHQAYASAQRFEGGASYIRMVAAQR